MNARDFQELLSTPETILDLTYGGPVVLTRPAGRNLVLLTEDEYLSLRETVDFLGSQLNTERLSESLEQSRTVPLNEFIPR